MTNNKIDISVIVPIYCNEGSITGIYNNLIKKIFPVFPDKKFEIIFIDDGSMDRSYAEMKNLKDSDDNVTLIKLTRNFGQVSAIYSGYSLAKGQGIINVSADGQEPTQLIIDIIDSFIKKESQIIAGSRTSRDESQYRKKTSNLFYYSMRKLAFPNMPKSGFDIVLISKKIKEELLKSNESNPFWQGQILWLGHSVKFIPYHRKKREIGTSKWSFGNKLKYLLDGILNYSYLPLRLFSLLGAISFIVGIVYSIVIFITYFFGNVPFKGWAPLMIVILVCSGLQLVMTGLIGEYLWRTLEQVKNRPKYIIEEIL